MGEEIVSLEEIHYEFWNKFVNKVFNDSEFKNNFNYRMPLNKSYYDLFWGNKDIHLCLRHNIKENYVSVETITYLHGCQILVLFIIFEVLLFFPSLD